MYPGRWAVPLGSGAAPLGWRLPESSRLFPVVSGPRAESVLIPGGLWSRPTWNWSRPHAPWDWMARIFMLEGLACSGTCDRGCAGLPGSQAGGRWLDAAGGVDGASVL